MTPNFGGGALPNPIGFSGSAPIVPVGEDLLGGIYHFLGLDAQNDPGTGPKAPPWIQQLAGPINRSAPQKAALFKAGADFIGGGFATPAGWVDAGYAIGDYIYGQQEILSGNPNLDTAKALLHTVSNYFGGDDTALQPTLRDVQTGSGVRVSSAGQATLAEAVWQFNELTEWSWWGNFNTSALSALTDCASLLAMQHLIDGVPLWSNPHFRMVSQSPGTLVMALGNAEDGITWQSPDPVDFTKVQLGDTVLTFLLRTQPEFAWQAQPFFPPYGQGRIWAADPLGTSFCWFICMLTDDELHLLAGGSTQPAGRWPGLAGVTLGTPVAVTSSQVVTAAMDGFLMDVVGLPPGQGHQYAGSVTRYPYIGWASFLDGDGYTDVLQRLELDKAVVMPHNLVRCAAVAVNAKPGLSITVTPFTMGAS